MATFYGLAQKVLPLFLIVFAIVGRLLAESFSVLCSLFFKKEMELSLIGLQNAGKTSLVNVLTTGAFHEDMIPTVGFNMRKVTKGAVTIKLWDLGGQVSQRIHLRARLLYLSVLLIPTAYVDIAAPIQKHVGEVLQRRAGHCLCCGLSRP